MGTVGSSWLRKCRPAAFIGQLGPTGAFLWFGIPGGQFLLKQWQLEQRAVDILQDLEGKRSVTLRVPDRRGLHPDNRWAWVLQGQGFKLDKYKWGKRCSSPGSGVWPCLEVSVAAALRLVLCRPETQVFKPSSAHPKAQLLSPQWWR